MTSRCAVTATSPQGHRTVILVHDEGIIARIETEAAGRGWTDIRVATTVLSVTGFRAGAAEDERLARMQAARARRDAQVQEG